MKATQQIAAVLVFLLLGMALGKYATATTEAKPDEPPSNTKVVVQQWECYASMKTTSELEATE